MSISSSLGGRIISLASVAGVVFKPNTMQRLGEEASSEIHVAALKGLGEIACWHISSTTVLISPT